MCIYRHHPLLHGLLVELPDPGDPFPDAARRRWLDTCSAVLDLLYGPVEVEQPAGLPVVADVAVPPGQVRIVPPSPFPRGVDVRDWPGVLLDLDAHAEAARIEAERYDLERLEAEAARPTPPPPSAHPTPLERVRGLLHEGGAYSRDGRFTKKLACPFVIEPDPHVTAPQQAAHPCGRPCSGENGLMGHLAKSHGLAGSHNAGERDRLVAQAVAAAEADLVAELEPTLTETVDAAQVDTEPLSWAPPIAPSPLDLDRIHADVFADADSAPSADTALWCPFADDDGNPCGLPFILAGDLDKHLRLAHRLTGVSRDEERRDYIDEAVEARAARIAAPGAVEPATMVTPAATDEHEATP